MLDKIIYGVVRVLAVLSAIAVVVMVIAVGTDVFVRNITGASLPGMIEIAETAMVTAVAFGLAWAGYNGEHVAVTLLTDRFGPRMARATNIFVWALVTFYSGWLAWANIVRSVDSTMFRETRFGIVQWPMYPMRWILTIGILALFVVAVMNLLRSLAGKQPTGFADEVEQALAEQGADTEQPATTGAGVAPATVEDAVQSTGSSSATGKESRS